MSSAIVKITPILGASPSSSGSTEKKIDHAYCTLLEIDSYKILLDVGLNQFAPKDSCDMYVNYKRLLKSVDVVLLSHSSLSHAGALPYLHANDYFSENIKIFSTIPTKTIGHLILYEYLDSLNQQILSADDLPFSYDSIDDVFDIISDLRFNQVAQLPATKSLSACPIAAGHSLGGAMWKIIKAEGNEEILYSVSFNHKKENHIDGADFSASKPPSLVICDVFRSLKVHQSRKDRDSTLISCLSETLKTGNSALIACEFNARLLELLVVLNSGAWSNIDKPLIYCLGWKSSKLFEYAKSLIEWAGSAVQAQFSANRENTFSLNNVIFVHTKEELYSELNNKKKITSSYQQHMPSHIVVASGAGLEHGFARQLLPDYVGIKGNLICIVNESIKGCLAYEMLHGSSLKTLSFDVTRKVELVGAELEAAKRQALLKKERSEIEESLKRKLEAKKKDEENDNDESEEEEDDDDESDHKPIGVSNGATDVAIVPNMDRLKEVYWTEYSSDLILIKGLKRSRIKEKEAHQSFMGLCPLSNNYEIFPLNEKKVIRDDYGIRIKFENFFPSLNAETAAKSNADSLMDISSFKSKKITLQNKEDQATPTKSITTKYKNVPMRATIKFIDFDGFTDGKSLKHIITQLSPRRMVLTGGETFSAASHLAIHLKRTLYSQEQESDSSSLVIPKAAESVNVSSGINSVRLKIDDSLIEKLKVFSYADYELAYMIGMIAATVEDGEDVKFTELSLVPLSTLENLPQHTPLLIGEVKLTEIKRALTMAGHKTAWVNGKLIVDDKITLKKGLNSNEIVLEGFVCNEYYQIRKMVYNLQVIL